MHRPPGARSQGSLRHRPGRHPDRARPVRGRLISGEPRVEPLTQREATAAAELLARAFRDNPLNVAVIGSDDPQRRLRSNRSGMRALLPTALRLGLVLGVRAQGDLGGALVATRPYAYPLPPAPAAARLRCLLGQGLRVATRWGEVFHALDRLHPLEPHWYLASVGVDPAQRGRGLGAAMVDALLERADAGAEPTYLETDRSENVGFYERRRFRVVGQTRLLGVPVWRMWRDARGAPAAR